MPAYELTPGDKVVFTRTLNIGKSSRDLLMRVAPDGDGRRSGRRRRRCLAEKDGFTLAAHPGRGDAAGASNSCCPTATTMPCRPSRRLSPPAASLEPFTKGGPRRWPEVLKTQAVVGADDGPFAVDVLTHAGEQPVELPDAADRLRLLPRRPPRRRLHLGRRRLAGRGHRRARQGADLAADRVGPVPAARA